MFYVQVQFGSPNFYCVEQNTSLPCAKANAFIQFQYSPMKPSIVRVVDGSGFIHWFKSRHIQTDETLSGIQSQER